MSCCFNPDHKKPSPPIASPTGQQSPRPQTTAKTPTGKPITRPQG